MDKIDYLIELAKCPSFGRKKRNYCIMCLKILKVQLIIKQMLKYDQLFQVRSILLMKQ